MQENAIQTTFNLPCCRHTKHTAMYNVVLHGVVFMILFAAFQTAAEYAEPVLADLNQANLGFESSAVVYATLAIGSFFAPVVVMALEPKWSMFAASLTYLLYLVALIWPSKTWILVVSGLLGFGGSVLWTAQGVFLCRNSDDNTRGTHSGIFWSLLQCRFLIGNAVAYINLSDSDASVINAARAKSFFSALLLLGTCGVCLLPFLRPSANDPKQVAASSPCDILKGMIKVLQTHHMTSPQLSQP